MRFVPQNAFVFVSYVVLISYLAAQFFFLLCVDDILFVDSYNIFVYWSLKYFIPQPVQLYFFSVFKLCSFFGIYFLVYSSHVFIPYVLEF
jgi:hypothetical protein